VTRAKKSSKYPDPADIGYPDTDDRSADQEYYTTILVTHNRLWLAFVVSALINVLLVVGLIAQASKFRPSIEYFTLDGGYPAVWNDRGNLTIDGTEYAPARLRAVVSSFISNRYGWDYQNTDKVRVALRLMSGEAQQAELKKIQDLNPTVNVVGASLKTELVIDYSNWKVIAQGNGRFEVVIEGQARITDIRNSNQNAPLVRPVVFNLVVQTVPATDVNPLGYEIISTGRDIL
jgi:hypothetical protein